MRSVAEVFIFLYQKSEIFESMELDRTALKEPRETRETFTRLSCEGQSFDVILLAPLVALDCG